MLRPVFTGLFLAFLFGLSAQGLPDEFYDEKYMGPFEFPTGITFDDTGRMFIWEKSGVVYIADTTGHLFQEPLIDISEEVANWKDHGLMGFALDPEFLINGYFYLLYALDLHYYDHYGTPAYSPDSTELFRPTIGRVTRYKADPLSNFSKALPDSRKVLLGETIDNGIPLLYEFHGLGSLVMGEDGTLLISCGDATSNAGPDTGGDSLGTMASAAIARGILSPDQDVGSYRAQYLGNYNGKILRIDPETGDGLPSNPFYDPEAPRSKQSRIWAYGLRNPYRFSMRPSSGSHFPQDGRPGILYVGDVGNGSWEELDIVQSGGQNFGWPIMEGHGSNWSFFSKEAPANPMAPNPLFGTGCNQEFFTFRDDYTNLTADGGSPPANPCNPNVPIEDYVVGYPPAILWSNARWNPPTRAIVPFFNDIGEINGAEIGTPQAGVEGENFDGYSSLSGLFYTGSNFPEAYRGKFFAVDFSGWIQVMNFTEDNRLLSVEPFHHYARDIIHMAMNPVDGKLYYINLQGEVRRISFGGNPAPVAIIKADQYYGASPLEVRFDGSESFDSNLPLVSYQWDFGDGQSSGEVAPSHTYISSGNGPQSFLATLTVTDSLGASTTAEAIISLNNTPPEVEITSFRDGDLYPLHEGTTLLRLAADVHDKEHSDDELTYEWRAFVHHNLHFHPDPVDFEHETFALISPLGCDGEEYWYRIELTVTDPEGLSTTRSQSIYPYCGSSFLEWTELAAEAESGQVNLQWTTSMEDSIQYYEVQRSSDFFHFKLLDIIEAEGGQGAASYNYADLNPRHGQNIYRVKAIREGGAYKYSNLANVGYPKSGFIQVYPNPAGTFFRVALSEAQAGTVALELFSNAGVRIFQSSWEAEPGQPFSRKILTRGFPNGSYYYRIINGEQEKVDKLIIAR
ncbi:MAG: PQQ-dependent sugar dehydrogenase [Phaeodactylibacter sp.]|nr:PQQ-dependent sugar dehydrogenase [Phaeodactylibacter sp.]MCB9265892.1 PQQ-dependent sugar dehydrogenase [Lewinellaceae bacterium]MCB9288692.1 PQQ-dependent sugar dehydrogenase [Lewinellaceae bacterium]